MLRQLKERAEESSQLALGDSPGMRLAAARAKRQLSQEQIANELNLSPKVISSLEADDYSGLPGTTFVRGYQRSYAKLVGLNDQMLFGESSPKPQEAPITVNPRHRAALKPRRSGNWGAWVAMVILVGAIASSVWWTITQSQFGLFDWLSVFQADKSSERIVVSAPTPIETHIETRSVTGGSALTELTTDELSDVDATVEQVAAAGGGDVVADVPLGDTQPPADSAVAAESPRNDFASTASLSRESVGETTTATALDSAITASAETTMAARNLEPLTFAADVLRIEASGDSWVEIVDVDGQRLFYGMLRDGASHELKGEAPFAVLLGDASMIRLELNQTPYDLSGHMRADRSARFTAGE